MTQKEEHGDFSQARRLLLLLLLCQVNCFLLLFLRQNYVQLWALWQQAQEVLSFEVQPRLVDAPGQRLVDGLDAEVLAHVAWCDPEPNAAAKLVCLSFVLCAPVRQEMRAAWWEL